LRLDCHSIATRLPLQVGPVESFQGQERRAIIVSTVRSSHDQLEFDRLHDMGFLGQAATSSPPITPTLRLTPTQTYPQPQSQPHPKPTTT